MVLQGDCGGKLLAGMLAKLETLLEAGI